MASRRDTLRRLLDDLPQSGASEDPDEQIRAVLRPVVGLALTTQGARPVPVDPTCCPNCGGPVPGERSPYCRPTCKAMSAFVRQFRTAVADGSILDPERQAGMGQALWALQGGGYPRRQLIVPARTVAKVIERQGGKCAVCGAPATQVDHTGSG